MTRGAVQTKAQKVQLFYQYQLPVLIFLPFGEENLQQVHQQSV